MKECKNCRFFDHDPADGAMGECTQQPLDIPGWEVVAMDDTCEEWKACMPGIITVHSEYHERHHVVVLKWNIDEGAYVPDLISKQYWEDKDDAIDDAVDRASNEMEYVGLDKLAYPVKI